MLFKNSVWAWLVKTKTIVKNIDAYRHRDIKGISFLVNILSPQQYCTIKVDEVTNNKQHIHNDVPGPSRPGVKRVQFLEHIHNDV